MSCRAVFRGGQGGTVAPPSDLLFKFSIALCQQYHAWESGLLISVNIKEIKVVIHIYIFLFGNKC